MRAHESRLRLTRYHRCQAARSFSTQTIGSWLSAQLSASHTTPRSTSRSSLPFASVTTRRSTTDTLRPCFPRRRTLTSRVTRTAAINLALRCHQHDRTLTFPPPGKRSNDRCLSPRITQSNRSSSLTLAV